MKSVLVARSSGIDASRTRTVLSETHQRVGGDDHKEYRTSTTSRSPPWGRSVIRIYGAVVLLRTRVSHKALKRFYGC